MKIYFPKSLTLMGIFFLMSCSSLHAAEAAAPHKKTLIDQLIEGGWVMIPIGICSILTVWLVGDGVTRTSQKKAVPAEHLEGLKKHFRAGDYEAAYQFAKNNPSPLTNVTRAGLVYAGDGKAVTENALAEELVKENAEIQTRLSYLSVIGVCTPMIGLLGTTTGMVKAFETLGTSGIGDPSGLSAAIGEVLVATASGLFVAIPAFGAFYFLKNRSTHMLHYVGDKVTLLFRKMPYEELAGVHIGDEELYAATPLASLLEKKSPDQQVPCPRCGTGIEAGTSQCAMCGENVAWA